MYTEMFMSGPNISLENVASAMADYKVLCNMYLMQSVVVDKTTNDYHTESGVKCDIFEIAISDLTSLWLGLQEIFSVHCAWLNRDNYNGCIMLHPGYRQEIAKLGIAQQECSEYD